MTGTGMSDTQTRARQVQSYLEQAGYRVHNFPRPTLTSSAAAEAVGCAVGEIAKSILLLVGQQPVLVVTSGDTRVKSGRLKQASGLSGKVSLPGPEEVVRCTGYAPGAVSPFLLTEELPVFLDRSLQRFREIYPAAGTGSSAVGLSFSRLLELTGARVVDVSEIQQQQIE
jgi:prolyl-tRNA editing enzyme YbaK/EbsC (Cys-tRNA(Pro) deacylase)